MAINDQINAVASQAANQPSNLMAPSISQAASDQSAYQSAWSGPAGKLETPTISQAAQSAQANRSNLGGALGTVANAVAAPAAGGLTATASPAGGLAPSNTPVPAIAASLPGTSNSDEYVETWKNPTSVALEQTANAVAGENGKGVDATTLTPVSSAYEQAWNSDNGGETVNTTTKPALAPEAEQKPAAEQKQPTMLRAGVPVTREQAGEMLDGGQLLTGGDNGSIVYSTKGLSGGNARVLAVTPQEALNMRARGEEPPTRIVDQDWIQRNSQSSDSSK